MSTAADVLRHLAAFNLKTHGNGKYTSNNPWRAGSDSGAFCVLIEDDEHGTYHDKVSGEAGSLYDLADKCSIPRPADRQAVKNSLITYAGLKEYAASKGVPIEAFTQVGWLDAPFASKGREAIKFKTQTGERWRFTDGKLPKYGNVTGYKACWYGLNHALTKVDPTDNILIIANGEPSVVVAQHFGLPVCAITGGENKNIRADLLDELKSKFTGRIIIALDCDNAGVEGAGKYHADLTAAGYEVAAVDLMLGDKGDVADFCILHDESAYCDLLASPILKPAVLIAAPPIPPAKTPAAPRVHDLSKTLHDLKQARVSGNADSQINLIQAAQTELDYLKAKLHVAPVRPVGDLLDAYSLRLEAAKRGDNGGYASGLRKQDDMIGKLRGGRIYTYLAETGVGKSTYTASIASALLQGVLKKPDNRGEGYSQLPASGLAVTTESMPLDWINQVVAHRTKIDTERLDNGEFTELEFGKCEAVVTAMHREGCRVLDAQNPTADAIEAAVLAGIQEYDYRWILIDSGSNVSTHSGDGIFDRTMDTMDMIQRMARLGLIVLVTWQVGRNLEGRNPRIPGRHDGKGGGRIEENTDVLMSLYNHTKLVELKETFNGKVLEPNPDFPEGTIYMRCVKHRRKGNAEGKHANFAWLGGCGVY